MAVDVAAIRVLLDRATKGPWYTVGHPWRDWGVSGSILAGNPDPHVGKMVVDGPYELDLLEDEGETDAGVVEQSDCDMDLIVALRNAAEELLAAYEKTLISNP